MASGEIYWMALLLIFQTIRKDFGQGFPVRVYLFLFSTGSARGLIDSHLFSSTRNVVNYRYYSPFNKT